MFKSVGKLFGMRRKAEAPKSRIDRRKTRVNMLDELLDDSDEGSYRSTTSVSSGSEYRESDDDGSYGSDSSYRPKRESDRDGAAQSSGRSSSSSSSSSGSSSSSSSEAGGGKSAVPRGRSRKRAASAAALEDDSSESSDSDVGTEPRRKALQKKRLKLPDSEDEAAKEKRRESELKKAKEAAAKRRERKSKLMELARRRKTVTPRRRRRTAGSEEEEEVEEVKEDKAENIEKAVESEESSSEEDPNPLMDSSEEEKHADSDSLKDFIVEEEGQKEGEEEDDAGEPKDKDFLSHLPRQFITGSQLTHFQVVVKALLINALDASFLKSLYDGERTKRYAQEMKSSLHHFDERLVLPRLENLKQRSRWKDRYKERVECYPKVRITMVNSHTKGCEACELHRHGRFSVRLSGQLYHCNTLQEDQFMPDDSQTFFVGSVCASRTEVYHALKHFKYHLFERCRTALRNQTQGEEQKDEEDDDEPVKDTVNKVFSKLQEEGWITKQYDEFQEHLNAADFFQEEKLD